MGKEATEGEEKKMKRKSHNAKNCDALDLKTFGKV